MLPWFQLGVIYPTSPPYKSAQLTVGLIMYFVGICEALVKARFSLVTYQVAGFVNVPCESVSVDGNWQVARTFLLIVRMWKLATLINFPLSPFLE